MERLYRSRSDRFIAGVAGGMAEYFRIDPTLVRLLWVAAGLMHGLGVIAYLIAMVVIPEEGRDTRSVEPYQSAGHGKHVVSDHPAEPGEQRSEPGYEKPVRGAGEEAKAARRKAAIGWVLVGIGAFFLVEMFFPYVQWDFVFPLVLIIAGVVLLVGRR